MEAGSAASWVSAIANLGVAVAAGFAARQGVRSLRAWRDETIGRRRIELAEEVIADFYEARDIIQWARAPFSFGSEVEQRPGRDTEDPNERARKDTFYVPLKRLHDHSEFFSKVQARRYRVIAAFGSDAANPYNRLREIHAKIWTAGNLLMGMTRGEDGQLWEDLNRTVTTVADPKDPIGAQLDQLVVEVETRFRPEIEAAIQ